MTKKSPLARLSHLSKRAVDLKEDVAQTANVLRRSPDAAHAQGARRELAQLKGQLFRVRKTEKKLRGQLQAAPVFPKRKGRK